MINRFGKLYILPLLLAVIVSACSPGGEPPPGARASQQVGASTASPQPSTPQPPAAQQPVAAPAPTSQPATTAVVTPQPAPPANAPKLLVPVTKIDFGKQPKDKTITREITLRNVGKSELKIESVVPS